jgi:hypothetical protein
MYFWLRCSLTIFEGVRCRKRFVWLVDLESDALSTIGRSEDALHFHVVEFDRREEAAAFVAALSRVLNSPRGDAYASRAVEVWVDTPSTASVRLFLSTAALDAAEAAFSPVRVGDSVSRESASRGHRLIIDGGVTPAWGLAEAESQLSDATKTAHDKKENHEEPGTPRR